MLRLLNFRCSFCSNPLDETQTSAWSTELRLAGARSVKAARALLDEHGGDVGALKEAEPWLFSVPLRPLGPRGCQTREPLFVSTTN